MEHARGDEGDGSVDIPDVVVSVGKELSENVDRHDSQALIRLDLQYRQHRLVEDRVSDILARVGVRRDLTTSAQLEESDKKS